VLAALPVTGIKRMIFQHDNGNKTPPKNNDSADEKLDSLLKLPWEWEMTLDQNANPNFVMKFCP